MVSPYNHHRRYPRRPVARPVLVKVMGDRPSEEYAQTRVIGLGGCCFLTDKSLGSATQLDLLISLDEGVIQADGRVVYEIPRSDSRREVGVEFLRLAPADRRRLEGLFV
jgi:hypothetical protein